MSKFLRCVGAAFIALTIAVPVVQPMAASAATTKESCTFQLLDHRIAAHKVLIDAQRVMTRDNFSFLSAVFGDGTIGELNSDRNSVARDLAQDYRFGLQDIRQERNNALEQFSSGACTGATTAARDREIRFYNQVIHQLNVAYLQAQLLLHHQYVIAVANCCPQ